MEFQRKKFYYRRRVRKGDPLSPLLFVLAADLRQNLLSLPINCPSCLDFPIIQYADDTLVIMKEDAAQLTCLKALLTTFAYSTGLKVNYQKSSMVPINMNEERLRHFTSTFNCQSGSFPLPILRYLWELPNHPWNISFQWCKEFKKG
jgi:hypothetical protein